MTDPAPMKPKSVNGGLSSRTSAVSAVVIRLMIKASARSTERTTGCDAPSVQGSTNTGPGETSVLGDEVLWRVEDGLDVVAVRIEDEGGVVATAVLGANPGRSDVCPAVVHCSVVPAHD